MRERDPEYDRFGPWVIEISELDPPPPLFLPYLTREELPLLSIKIPRKIDRRNARPGMNMYDYMVTLYETDMVIFERDGDDVRSQTFFYRDVHLLRYGTTLLRGNLHLGMVGKVYDLPFNTVSSDVMQKLVDLIRQRYTTVVGHMALEEEPDFSDEGLSFFFSRLLAKEKKQNPQLRLLASQIETAVGSYETGFFRRHLFGVIKKLLLESLHLSDGRELKIISRDKTYRYKWQVIHGQDTSYIPIDNITGVTWEAEPKNTAVYHLTLQTAGGNVSFAFVRENPSLPSYARFLSELYGLPDGSNADMEPLR